MFKTIIAAITMLILDGIWLKYIGKKFYIEEMGHLMRMSDGVVSPLWIPVIIVYAALVLGIVLFVIPKAHGVALNGLLWGGVFGLITYAIYDFTNLAILANWSLKISIIDACWGMILCGITSFITILVTT